MFTGIIESLGTVSALTPTSGGARIEISMEGWTDRVRPGDSVAVNGVCLTALAPTAGRMQFDVIRQTLSFTTLGDLDVGHRVNLEASVTPQTALGGHFVQGHVDDVGRVCGVTDTAEEYRVRIEPPEALMEAIVPRGSIAIDGISLTLADVDESTFEVALIPTTLDRTNARSWTVGARVNLETDIVAKTVVHWLERAAIPRGS